jgi:hypothetical protein
MGVTLLHSINHLEADRAQRVQVTFQGRYMLTRNNEEYPCHSYAMSTGDVSLFAPVSPAPGDGVVLYLNELGRFTGQVIRPTEIGFEMTLQLTAKKRDRLTAQLDWYARRATEGVEDRRRHDRIVPLMDLTVLRLTRGDEHVVRIRSLSLSGVALETDHVIPLGAEVRVGNTPARVVRVLDDGVACEFVRHFREGEIDETTRL